MRVRQGPADDNWITGSCAVKRTGRTSPKIFLFLEQQYYDRHPPAVYSQYSKRGKIMTNAELNTFLDLEWNCAAFTPEEASVSAPLSPTQWARILSAADELGVSRLNR